MPNFNMKTEMKLNRIPLLREMRFIASISATTVESKERSKGAPMGSALDSRDVISTDCSVGISSAPV